MLEEEELCPPGTTTVATSVPRAFTEDSKREGRDLMQRRTLSTTLEVGPEEIDREYNNPKKTKLKAKLPFRREGQLL